MYPKVYLFKRIQNVKILIDRNYSYQVKLDEIALKVHLSKFHMIRLFKKAYGLTPHQYLIKKRIEAAKSLLQKEKAVKEACYRVGFASVTSFSILFKKETGLAPSTFRFINEESNFR